jgi:FMN phosphatase YigB (HAD superfamily)
LGKVDNRARRLIQKARAAGWRTATWLDDEG